MNLRFACKPLFAFAAFALAGSIALAQQPASPSDNSAPAAAPVERHAPPPPQGPGNMRGGMRPNIRPAIRVQMDRNRGFHGQDHGQMDGGGFHIGPSGMWWKNPMIVQRLTLTPEQTKKMDDIFQQSRIQLIDLKANVEKQQVLLEPLISANPVEVTRAMAQIDKVAEARADLEKADAKMLLGIRAVLTADQWTKLRDHRFGGQGDPAGAGAAGGAGGGGRTRGMHGGGPTPGNTSNLIDPINVP